MTTESKTTYTGSCLCGSVKYEVDKLEPNLGHCHCSMCRKFHGAAFATFGEAKTENFRWVEGESNLASYIANNNTIRKFCKFCGSSMTFTPSQDNGELIEFTLGTLDSDIDLRPDAHIFTNYKANWSDIEDGLLKYSEGRDSTLVKWKS